MTTIALSWRRRAVHHQKHHHHHQNNHNRNDNNRRSILVSVMVCCSLSWPGLFSPRIRVLTRSKYRPSSADRIMGWYAIFLLQPFVKAVVMVGFLALFIACGMSATKFTEEFNFKEALPRDSYVLDYAVVYEGSSDLGRVEPNVYFRYVDFNDTDVRRQMRAYLKDLAASPHFEGPPEAFWLDFFEWHVGSLPANMTFNEQMRDFLSVQIYKDLFGSSLGTNDDGDVIASRVRMRMVVDVAFFCYDGESKQNDKNYNDGRSESIPISTNTFLPMALTCFSSYSGVFKLWEFLKIARRELISTAVVSIAAVALVAFIFIPHWSAICFVLPIVFVLFIDLIGMIQWAGLHLNPVSYVSCKFFVCCCWLLWFSFSQTH
jgi:hypothetical protein